MKEVLVKLIESQGFWAVTGIIFGGLFAFIGNIVQARLSQKQMIFDTAYKAWVFKTNMMYNHAIKSNKKFTASTVEAYIFHLNSIQKYLNKKEITEKDKEEISNEIKKNKALAAFINDEVKNN